MFYKSTLLVFCLAPIFIFSQNLVPNWSFENVDCQTELPDTFVCPIWRNAPWYTPTEGTSDSFNTCHTDEENFFNVPDNFMGSQQPNNSDDDGYTGIITYEDGHANYREYLQVQLIEPLIAGETYILGFKCSLADNCLYAADGLGMFLSVNSIIIDEYSVIPAIPQLSIGVEYNEDTWSNYEQEFVAEGGENYLTIGNFFSDDNTTMVYLGQSGYHRAYYYVDEVKVIPLANDIHSMDNAQELFTLAPNPTADAFKITLDDAHDNTIQLFDQSGKEVTALVTIDILGENEVGVDISQLANGLYLVKTETGYGRIVKQDID